MLLALRMVLLLQFNTEGCEDIKRCFKKRLLGQMFVSICDTLKLLTLQSFRSRRPNFFFLVLFCLDRRLQPILGWEMGSLTRYIRAMVSENVFLSAEPSFCRFNSPDTI